MAWMPGGGPTELHGGDVNNAPMVHLSEDWRTPGTPEDFEDEAPMEWTQPPLLSGWNVESEFNNEARNGRKAESGLRLRNGMDYHFQGPGTHAMGGMRRFDLSAGAGPGNGSYQMSTVRMAEAALAAMERECPEDPPMASQYHGGCGMWWQASCSGGGSAPSSNFPQGGNYAAPPMSLGKQAYDASPCNSMGPNFDMSNSNTMQPWHPQAPAPHHREPPTEQTRMLMMMPPPQLRETIGCPAGSSLAWEQQQENEHSQHQWEMEAHWQQGQHLQQQQRQQHQQQQQQNNQQHNQPHPQQQQQQWMWQRQQQPQQPQQQPQQPQQQPQQPQQPQQYQQQPPQRYQQQQQYQQQPQLQQQPQQHQQLQQQQRYQQQGPPQQWPPGHRQEQPQFQLAQHQEQSMRPAAGGQCWGPMDSGCRAQQTPAQGAWMHSARPSMEPAEYQPSHPQLRRQDWQDQAMSAGCATAPHSRAPAVASGAPRAPPPRNPAPMIPAASATRPAPMPPPPPPRRNPTAPVPPDCSQPSTEREATSLNEQDSSTILQNDEDVTTVMLRNIACRYTQEDVADILNNLGLKGKFDFVYLPRSPTRSSNLGYAFVNFIAPQYVQDCYRLLNGQVFGASCTMKTCQVTLAHVQGFCAAKADRPRRKNRSKSQAQPLYLDNAGREDDTESQQEDDSSSII